jgi:endonuclease/exonuclease/phosphatase family metal-dependent hydrolase
MTDGRQNPGTRMFTGRRHALAPGHTFPSWGPHLRLDYVFAPTKYENQIERCDVVLSGETAAASDHLPGRG